MRVRIRIYSFKQYYGYNGILWPERKDRRLGEIEEHNDRTIAKRKKGGRKGDGDRNSRPDHPKAQGVVGPIYIH